MIKILQGDWIEQLRTLHDASVHCCVTSPPYWGLRDYGVAGQLGLEKTPGEYVAKLVEGFREVRRVLRDDGTLWLNLGDSYCANGGGGESRMIEIHGPLSPKCKGIHSAAGNGQQSGSKGCKYPGLKPKDLCGIPWRVAFALQADGWYLRSDIIWAKPNPMPESVTDRPTKSHEYIFLLSKSERYFYDSEAIKEPSIDPESLRPEGRNPRGDDKYAKAFLDENRNGYARTRDGFSKLAGACYPTRNRRTVWTVPSQPFSDWTRTDHWNRVERGAVSCGSLHIASPDCPVHGGLFDLLATALCDGREAGFGNRTFDSGICLVRVQEGGSDPSLMLRAWDYAGCSLDSLLRKYGLIATWNNTQTRKTAPAGDSMFACKPSVQRCDYIASRLEKLGWSARHRGIFASNTLPDEMDADLLPQMISRILGKQQLDIYSSCCCGFYHKTTEKASHFATFPEDLIKPCILAGTSAKGCCLKCGAPWERVMNLTDRVNTRPGNPMKNDDSRNDSETRNKRYVSTYETTGWQPTCECYGGKWAAEFSGREGEPPLPGTLTPCTVLDPFGGSGTTGQVAMELGRKAILIELNPKYVELMKARTNVTPGLPLA